MEPLPRANVKRRRTESNTDSEGNLKYCTHVHLYS